MPTESRSQTLSLERLGIRLGPTVKNYFFEQLVLIIAIVACRGGRAILLLCIAKTNYCLPLHFLVCANYVCHGDGPSCKGEIITVNGQNNKHFSTWWESLLSMM